ncbi:geranylgeranylglyceryl/heptaprenylglyceryl phosphate synthase [Candidatus Poribacteria bacterium]|nr:geranylgeranylglyceryl/heptaprenylglyceryl phosphate synthase [Candidatus Poribacteria bacterium]
MQLGSVLDYLLNVRRECKAGYWVLIDPDRYPIADCIRLAHQAEDAGVDALLLGGSFLTVELNPIAEALQGETSLPLILFPGDSMHLSRHADAILYLSLISGRNANFLIGEQVKAAPLIQRYGIEPIPTGYMLVDGGCQTSVGFMSGTSPLPRDKFDIAWAHALAAQYLGMKLIYLEAGSGANLPVPDGMIAAIKKQVSIPIIVGGGIKTPEIAIAKVNAGADFIVTGTVIEHSHSLMKQFAEAIHAGT